MEQGSRAVADGASAVENAAELLRQIIESIDTMSSKIQAIAGAAEGLAAGSEEDCSGYAAAVGHSTGSQQHLAAVSGYRQQSGGFGAEYRDRR